MRTIHPRLTPGRRRWLEKLAADGVANRPRGVVGYDCMLLKWTEWAVTDPETGKPITYTEWRSKYATDEMRWTDTIGEMLTDEGRRVLGIAE